MNELAEHLLTSGLMGLLIWILTRVYNLKGDLGKFRVSMEGRLNEHLQKIEEVVQREKEESILAQRRIDVHDNFSSHISEEPFNSRQVVKGSRNPPKLNRRLARAIVGQPKTHEDN